MAPSWAAEGCPQSCLPCNALGVWVDWAGSWFSAANVIYMITELLLFCHVMLLDYKIYSMDPRRKWQRDFPFFTFNCWGSEEKAQSAICLLQHYRQRTGLIDTNLIQMKNQWVRKGILTIYKPCTLSAIRVWRGEREGERGWYYYVIFVCVTSILSPIVVNLHVNICR